MFAIFLARFGRSITKYCIAETGKCAGIEDDKTKASWAELAATLVDKDEIYTRIKQTIPLTFDKEVKLFAEEGSKGRYEIEGVTEVEVTTDNTLKIEKLEFGTAYVTLKIMASAATDNVLRVTGSGKFGNKKATTIQFGDQSRGIIEGELSGDLYATIIKDPVTASFPIYYSSSLQSKIADFYLKPFKDCEILMKPKDYCFAEDIKDGDNAEKVCNEALTLVSKDIHQFETIKSIDATKAFPKSTIFLAKDISIDVSSVHDDFKAIFEAAADKYLTIQKVESVTIKEGKLNIKNFVVSTVNVKLELKGANLEIKDPVQTSNAANDFGNKAATTIILTNKDSTFTGTYSGILSAMVSAEEPSEDMNAVVKNMIKIDGFEPKTGLSHIISVEEAPICIGADKACGTTGTFDYIQELDDVKKALTGDKNMQLAMKLTIPLDAISQSNGKITLEGSGELILAGVEEIGVTAADTVRVNDKLNVEGTKIDFQLSGCKLTIDVGPNTFGTADTKANTKVTLTKPSTEITFTQTDDTFFGTLTNGAALQKVYFHEVASDATDVTMENLVASQDGKAEKRSPVQYYFCSTDTEYSAETGKCFDTVANKPYPNPTADNVFTFDSVLIKEGSYTYGTPISSFKIVDANTIEIEDGIKIISNTGDGSTPTITLSLPNSADKYVKFGDDALTGLSLTLKVNADHTIIDYDTTTPQTPLTLEASGLTGTSKYTFGYKCTATVTENTIFPTHENIDLVDVSEYEKHYCLSEKNAPCIDDSFPQYAKHIASFTADELSKIDSTFKSTVTTIYSIIDNDNGVEIDLTQLPLPAMKYKYMVEKSATPAQLLEMKANNLKLTKAKTISLATGTEKITVTGINGNSLSIVDGTHCEVHVEGYLVISSSITELPENLLTIVFDSKQTDIVGQLISSGTFDNIAIKEIEGSIHSWQTLEGLYIPSKISKCDDEDLDRIIICPRGSHSHCATQMEAADPSLLQQYDYKQFSLFYDVHDFDVVEGVYPPPSLSAARKAKTLFAYLKYDKPISIPVDFGASNVILLEKASGDSAKLLAEDPNTVVFGAPDKLDMTLGSNIKLNQMNVDVSNAPSNAIVVSVGSNLVIKKGTEEGDPTKQIALEFNKESTTIAFDSISLSDLSKLPSLQLPTDKKATIYTGKIGTKEEDLGALSAFLGVDLTDENSKFEVKEGDPPTPTPTPTPAPEATTSSDAAPAKSGLSGGAIAGIVIACVVVVAAAIIIPLFIMKKKKASGVSNTPV